MRILHAVTLFSASGTYGGPVSAALAQCEGLAERGHAVTLAAGWDGSERPQPSGIQLRLHRVRQFPGSGLAGLFSVPMICDLWRLTEQADVVHVHLARDLITLPAAAIAILRKKPLVVQTHGMVRVDHRLRARAVDFLATRRVLSRAAVQLVLTDDEQRDAHLVARRTMPTARVVNGVPDTPFRTTWPATGRPDVIFCARLHPDKGPVLFVDMAATLLRQGLDATFSLVGPDGGMLDTVLTKIAEQGDDRIRYEGTLMHGQVAERLARSHVSVLPSRREHLSMVILEGLAVGLPAVVVRDSGLPELITGLAAVTATDACPRDLAAAVTALLGSKDHWRDSADRAIDAAAASFSAARVVEDLEKTYVTVSRQS